MWKFQDFSATQILREINFDYFGALKTTVLTNLALLKFDFWKFLTISITKFPKLKIQSPPKKLRRQFFSLLKLAQIDFTENQSGNKIAKFSH